MQPIKWPEGMPSQKRGFMDGVPFIGTHVRVIKNAKLLLQRRSQDSVQKSWIEYEAKIPNLKIREKMFSIAKSYMNWPNNLFIPEDTAAIVFGFIPGIWIDPIDLLGDIAEFYEIAWVDPTSIVANLKEKSDIKKEWCFEIYESVLNDSLIDFFSHLQEIKEKKTI